MHFCPDVPHLLIGTKLDCRNDSTIIEKLRASNQQPITTAKVRCLLHHYIGVARLLDTAHDSHFKISTPFVCARYSRAVLNTVIFIG